MLHALLTSEVDDAAGAFPDLGAALRAFDGVDRAALAAAAAGVGAGPATCLQPPPGASPAFDEACAAERECLRRAADVVAEFRRLLGSADVQLRDVGALTHVLEVPVAVVQAAAARGGGLPPSLRLVSATKQAQRFTCPALDAARSELAQAAQARQEAAAQFVGELVSCFDAQRHVWARALDVLAHVDALLGLARAADALAQLGPACFPHVVDSPEPFFAAVGCSHPLVARALQRSGQAFVGNDISLGCAIDPAAAAAAAAGGHGWTPADESPAPASPAELPAWCRLTGAVSPRFLVITGPNMGGKSTLLRQVGVATVLAQLGCAVPAVACALSPADRVFTRIGARDAIVQGRSTFFTELSEAALVLKHATPRSLVLVDELGRGTSTFDGMAVSAAVVQHLTGPVRPLCLFTTHYHALVSEYTRRADVRVCHMGHVVVAAAAAAAARSDSAESEQLVFLFTLEEGPVGRSFGMNVARAAGLPQSLINRAHHMSMAMEHRVQALRAGALFDAVKQWLAAAQASGAPWPPGPATADAELVQLWGQAGMA